LRLQNLARGDEGFLLALGYSTQRGYARKPSVRRRNPHRRGRSVEVHVPKNSAFDVPVGRIHGHRMPDGQPVQGLQAKAPPQFTRGYGLVFGHSERKAMAMALVDRALSAGGTRRRGRRAGVQDEEFVLSHSDNIQATGFVEHLKLPHYVDFQAELEPGADGCARNATPATNREAP
jgi:alpha-D-ribose 1-methylphosphonate 5-triphosphate synthase subunit PhnI